MDYLKSLKTLQEETESQPGDVTIDASSIGGRIRLARKKIDLNQAALAERLSVTQPTVANWESGVHDPRQLMLAKLAEVLQVDLGWLASGERSAKEQDKHPAAAYLRRHLHHVPVISLDDAAKAAANPKQDFHQLAMDYIPVTAGVSNLFACFVRDEAMNLAFPGDTLVVIDVEHRTPADGDLVMMLPDDAAPMLRRWKTRPNRLEPYSSDPKHETIYLDTLSGVIGTVIISIHFH